MHSNDYITMNIQRLDLAKPVMAQFELTDLCNHMCVHCYHYDSASFSSKKQVSDETVLAVAHEIINAHIFNVVITGGEPLIKQNLSKKIISLLYDNDVQVGLNSNITLLSNEFLDFIKEHKINILTSCPSSNKDKYNHMVGANKYDVFIERLKRIYDVGAHCTVNMVVNKENIQEIKATALFLKEIGCYSFSATPMFLNINNPQKDLLLSKDQVARVVDDLLWVETELKMKVDILESLPKCIFAPSIRNGTHSFLNRKCQAGRTVVGVSPNGDIRPCSTNTEVYGNILHEDIRDIWKKMTNWRSTEYFPDECKKCSWIDRCNAGCRINSKAYYGQWNSPEIWSDAPILEPPESDYKNYVLKNDSKITINKEFSYREEYENIFVIYNRVDESFMMVNKSLMDFIISLKTLTFSTVADLAKAYNASTSEIEFVNTINLLINKKILEYE